MVLTSLGIIVRGTVIAAGKKTRIIQAQLLRLSQNVRTLVAQMATKAPGATLKIQTIQAWSAPKSFQTTIPEMATCVAQKIAGVVGQKTKILHPQLQPQLQQQAQPQQPQAQQQRQLQHSQLTLQITQLQLLDPQSVRTSGVQANTKMGCVSQHYQQIQTWNVTHLETTHHPYVGQRIAFAVGPKFKEMAVWI